MTSIFLLAHMLAPYRVGDSLFGLCSWPIYTALERLVCFSRSPMAAATAAGAAAAAAAVSLIACYLLLHKSRPNLPWVPTVGFSRARNRRARRRGLVEAIGNTPLIRINSLSDATGCEVRAWNLTYVAPL